MMYRPILCFLIAIILFSCRKEEKFTISPEAKLSFSTDTIFFDTVFTSVNSITQNIKVFNYNKNAVRIAEIRLTGGSSSPFQINMNGSAAGAIQNTELRGNDSLNIFVKVAINPNTNTLPFKVEDAIDFTTNGNRQSVKLKAYGQNAHFLKDAIIAQNTVWDNKIPYIIYNSVRISSNTALTIPAKSRIYFHKNAKMVIDGTLNIDGNSTDSVVLSSDRLEPIYDREPGQWGGLHFTGSSKSNKINYASIKNAIVGIQADSLSTNSDPKLLLVNSTLKNMQAAAFTGYKTSLAAFNNLIFNCGQYIIYGVYGGDYNLKQNTFVNYSSSVPRQTASLFFADNYPGTSKTALLSANLSNNIVYGGIFDELVLNKKGNMPINMVLQNNVIKTNNTAFGTTGNILNTDPLFISLRNDNYRLNNNSPASNKGTDLSTDFYYSLYLKTDRTGKMRLFPSEIGCYEN